MNTRYTATFLAMTALSFLSAAQISIQESVVTDSVDVFTPAVQSKKSPQLAMAQSLLLPGLGHQYLDKKERALTYFTAEALFIFGAVFCEQYSNRMRENARTYAWFYANAQGGPGTDDSYWQNLSNFLDSRGYNAVQELNRTPEKKYVDANLQWSWVDSASMVKYHSMSDDATRFGIASSFFIGAMVLDRVVSFIDVRAATRYKGIKSLTQTQIIPIFSSDFSELGIALSCTF